MSFFKEVYPKLGSFVYSMNFINSPVGSTTPFGRLSGTATVIIGELADNVSSIVELDIIAPAPYGFGISIAMYDHDKDPYLLEEYLRVASTIDSAERTAGWKALGLYYLEKATHIGFAQPAGLNAWWPWLKNYYGEIDVGHLNSAPMMARLWIDEDLKAELGY